MRCPECKSTNEANAAVCKNCGLILLKPADPNAVVPIVAAAAEAPKRRADDYAGARRRASDTNVPCQFCGGEIASKAIRCRHCSEIVNEDYYRERSHRLRSRINYSSWVAYLFGLGALLVFRPVGILSIAAGLILSIIYYAIPVEPPSSSKQKDKKKGSFLAFLKRQMKMERVQIPIPTMRNTKIVLVGTPLVAALIGYSANLFLLQEPVNQVLRENNAFSGMKVSAHYEYWIVPGVIVYDLREISIKQTPMDVHTALLEFAKKVKDKRYSRIELSYKGTTKFSIDGESFSRVGQEYAKKNYDYVLYSFPRLFHAEDGVKKVDAKSDRDALLNFHKQWYGEDSMTRTVANGM
jgi:hypothetical protein